MIYDQGPEMRYHQRLSANLGENTIGLLRQYPLQRHGPVAFFQDQLDESPGSSIPASGNRSDERHPQNSSCQKEPSNSRHAST